MNYSAAYNLWLDLLTDLESPDFLSQLLVLVICVLAGWVLSRSWSKRFSLDSERLHALTLPADSFRTVLTPLFIVIFIELAIGLMKSWHHVGLLRVAVPLLLSFSLIRAVFFFIAQSLCQRRSRRSLHASLRANICDYRLDWFCTLRDRFMA